MGYRWTKKPSGQYIDGHERADVVYYRQQVFLPAWAELDQQTRNINPFLIRHERKVKQLSYGSTTNLRFTPMIDELLNGFTRVRKRCLELKAKVHLS